MLRSICFRPETTPFCVMANDENVTRFVQKGTTIRIWILIACEDWHDQSVP